MEEAVPINSPVQTFKKLEKDLPTPESVADAADRGISKLAGDPAWKELQKTIDQQIEMLLKVEGITETDTIETVGIKFMVSRLAVSQLLVIRNLPEAIAEGLKNGAAK
jgi:hypothetical protein